LDMIDIHCHLIPKVDDGAENFRMTQKMLYKSADDGVKAMVLTPHCRPELFHASSREIEVRFNKTREMAAKSGIDIDLYLGREFHSRSDTLDIIRKAPRYALGCSRYILLEFSERHPYNRIRNQVYELTAAGYIPVIAHAERYPCLCRNPETFEELRSEGALIQVNAGSVLGLDGWKVSAMCAKLLKKEWIDIIASDAHNMSARRPVMGECAKFLEKKVSARYAKRLLYDNAACIINEIK